MLSIFITYFVVYRSYFNLSIKYQHFCNVEIDVPSIRYILILVSKGLYKKQNGK